MRYCTVDQWEEYCIHTKSPISFYISILVLQIAYTGKFEQTLLVHPINLSQLNFGKEVLL